jgi:hypothetical protein
VSLRCARLGKFDVKLQVEFNGGASAFHSDSAGSIPVTRSRSKGSGQGDIRDQHRVDPPLRNLLKACP